MVVYTFQKKIRPYYEITTIIAFFTITFIAYLISAVKIMPRADELDYLTHAENILKGKITLSPQRGYFFSVVLASTFFIFGNKLIVAQTTSALIGALVIIPTYLFTKEFFIEKSYNRLLGMVTAMMVSWIIFKYAIEIRNDMLFLLFYMSACYYGVKGTSDPKFLKYAGLFIGLAYFTRDPGILLLPILIIYFMLNSNHDIKLKGKARLRLLFDRKILLMLVIFLLVIFPKYILRWYVFGHPFYVLHSYTYFWIDNYTDKYFHLLSNSQASASLYLRTHTIPQLINRWLTGADALIGRLKYHISWPFIGNPNLRLIIFFFSVVGLIVFLKKKYILLHLNLILWLLPFSWLFAIYVDTRWILPMFPFLVIAAVSILIEIAILIERIIDKLLYTTQFRSSYKRFVPKIPSSLIGLYHKIKPKMKYEHIKIFTLMFFIGILFTSYTAGVIVRVEKGFSNRGQDERYYLLREMTDWISSNTPEDALFMSEQEDIIEYYGHRDAMFIPPSDLDFIIQVMNDKGVNYLTVDTDTINARPALKPVFEGKLIPQGLTLVYENILDDSSEIGEYKIQIYSYMSSP